MKVVNKKSIINKNEPTKLGEKMKLNHVIMGCALAFGLMAFVPVQTHAGYAILYAGQTNFFAPLTLKSTVSYLTTNKTKVSIKQAKFTSKEALADLGFSKDVTLAVGNATYNDYSSYNYGWYYGVFGEDGGSYYYDIDPFGWDYSYIYDDISDEMAAFAINKKSASVLALLRNANPVVTHNSFETNVFGPNENYWGAEPGSLISDTLGDDGVTNTIVYADTVNDNDRTNYMNISTSAYISGENPSGSKTNYLEQGSASFQLVNASKQYMIGGWGFYDATGSEAFKSGKTTHTEKHSVTAKQLFGSGSVPALGPYLPVNSSVNVNGNATLPNTTD